MKPTLKPIPPPTHSSTYPPTHPPFGFPGIFFKTLSRIPLTQVAHEEALVASKRADDKELQIRNAASRIRELELFIISFRGSSAHPLVKHLYLNYIYKTCLNMLSL
jgi:hypothetical protein